MSVAWSPDGRWLATASHDKTVHIYRKLGTVTESTGEEGEDGTRRAFAGLERVHTARFVVTPECVVFVPSTLTTTSSSSSSSNNNSGSAELIEVLEWELVVALRDTAHLCYIDCTVPADASTKEGSRPDRKSDQTQDSAEQHVDQTASALPSFKARKVSLNEADWDTHVSFTPLCLSLSPDHQYLLIATDKGFHFVVRVGSSKRLRLLAGGHSCGDYGKPKVCLSHRRHHHRHHHHLCLSILPTHLILLPYHAIRCAGTPQAITFTATATRAMPYVCMLSLANDLYKSSLVYIKDR